MNERLKRPLHIVSQPSNYFDAFVPMSTAGEDINSVSWNSSIIFEAVSVDFFNGSFYIKTLSEFASDARKLKVRVKVRSSETYFDHPSRWQKSYAVLARIHANHRCQK